MPDILGDVGSLTLPPVAYAEACRLAKSERQLVESELVDLNAWLRQVLAWLDADSIKMVQAHPDRFYQAFEKLFWTDKCGTTPQNQFEYMAAVADDVAHEIVCGETGEARETGFDRSVHEANTIDALLALTGESEQAFAKIWLTYLAGLANRELQITQQDERDYHDLIDKIIGDGVEEQRIIIARHPQQASEGELPFACVSYKIGSTSDNLDPWETKHGLTFRSLADLPNVEVSVFSKNLRGSAQGDGGLNAVLREAVLEMLTLEKADPTVALQSLARVDLVVRGLYGVSDEDAIRQLWEYMNRKVGELALGSGSRPLWWLTQVRSSLDTGHSYRSGAHSAQAVSSPHLAALKADAIIRGLSHKLTLWTVAGWVDAQVRPEVNGREFMDRKREAVAGRLGLGNVINHDPLKEWVAAWQACRPSYDEDDTAGTAIRAQYQAYIDRQRTALDCMSGDRANDFYLLATDPQVTATSIWDLHGMENLPPLDLGDPGLEAIFCQDPEIGYQLLALRGILFGIFGVDSFEGLLAAIPDKRNTRRVNTAFARLSRTARNPELMSYISEVTHRSQAVMIALLKLIGSQRGMNDTVGVASLLDLLQYTFTGRTRWLRYAALRQFVVILAMILGEGGIQRFAGSNAKVKNRVETNINQIRPLILAPFDDQFSIVQLEVTEVDGLCNDLLVREVELDPSLGVPDRDDSIVTVYEQCNQLTYGGKSYRVLTNIKPGKPEESLVVKEMRRLSMCTESMSADTALRNDQYGMILVFESPEAFVCWMKKMQEQAQSKDIMMYLSDLGLRGFSRSGGQETPESDAAIRPVKFMLNGEIEIMCFLDFASYYDWAYSRRAGHDGYRKYRAKNLIESIEPHNLGSDMNAA
jgi:hypothetical protein